MTYIKEKIKQSKAWPSEDVETLIHLVMAANRLQKKINQRLADFGFTQSQFNTLRIIHGAGEEGISVKDIIDRMVHETPNVARIAQFLVKKGYISKSVGEKDRRSTVYSITEDGRKSLQTISENVLDLDDFFKGIASDCKRHLIETCDSIFENLDQE